MEGLQLRDDELEVEYVLPDAVKEDDADCEGGEEEADEDGEEDC